MSKNKKEKKELPETSMGMSLIDLIKTEIKMKLWQLGIIFIIGIVLGVMLK